MGTKVEIAICDANALDRTMLCELIQQWMDAASMMCRFSQFDDGQALIYEVEDGSCYDVIFMDMHLAPMSGLETARRLRRMNYTGAIVLQSNDMRGAINSYTVNASGYLLKPQSYDLLQRVLNRILRMYRNDTYMVRFRSKTVHVPYCDIQYVESDNNCCRIHCADTVYTVYRKLDDIQTELNNRVFLRCHQSFLVNMNYIREVDRQFELLDGTLIPIRQRGQRDIRMKYLAYREGQYQLRIPLEEKL